MRPQIAGPKALELVIAHWQRQVASFSQLDGYDDRNLMLQGELWKTQSCPRVPNTVVAAAATAAARCHSS